MREPPLIEAKHITKKSAQDVVKTLDGLKGFYESHPNVRVLLFVVLIDADVPFNDEAAESNFSRTAAPPFVLTRFVRRPIAHADEAAA